MAEKEISNNKRTVKRIPATGKYGRMLILKEVEGHRSPDGRIKRKVECVCDCGAVKNVIFECLRSGTTQSCGCLNREINKKRCTIHGEASRNNGVSGTYSTWTAMKARCHRVNTWAYQFYGARGIFVCPEWLNSFAKFREDMGNRPDGMCIDRIDNSKGYFKENCRWTTMKVQMNNSRTNKLVSFRGETKTISQWSAETGLRAGLISERLNKLGWTPEEALTRSPRPIIKAQGKSPSALSTLWQNGSITHFDGSLPTA